MLSLCLIPDNISLNHFVKVVSAGFLHCYGTTMFFVINKSPMGRCFETM